MVNTDLDIKVNDEGVLAALARIGALGNDHGARMTHIATVAAADEVKQDYGPRWAEKRGEWYRRGSAYQNWKKDIGGALAPGVLTGTTQEAITPFSGVKSGMVFLQGTWPQYGLIEYGYHETSQMTDEDIEASKDPLGPRSKGDGKRFFNEFGSVRQLLESYGYDEGSVPLATKRYGEWDKRDIDFMFLSEDNIDVIMGYMEIFLEREVLEGVEDARITKLLQEEAAQAEPATSVARREWLLAERESLRAGEFGAMNPETAISRLQRIERLLRKKGWL